MTFKDKVIDFVYGKKCPKCKGRLNISSIGYKECPECGYKEEG